MIATPGRPFQMTRLGLVMEPEPANPLEAWGVLNPAGARGPDGAYYLFPRLVAQGNYSRIGRARVLFDGRGNPARVERRGCALEPQQPYERTTQGGGVEDPRVSYVQPLGLFVMTYTAYAPPHPRVALAVSRDLARWERLGLLCYATAPDTPDLNTCPNKDALIFPDVVQDAQGRASLAILHRPTVARIRAPHSGDMDAPALTEYEEHIWISFAPLDAVRDDPRRLTSVAGHRMLMAPQAPWEELKIGGGAPPVRLPYGWLLVYHGVSAPPSPDGNQRRYCAGAAILDLDVPTRVLYRSPQPILEPQAPHETRGSVPDVVFPTATDLRGDGRLDVYYGAADSVIGAARMALPAALPAEEEGAVSSLIHV